MTVDSVYDYEAGSGAATKLGRTVRTEYRDGANVVQATVTPTYDGYGRVDTIAEWTPLAVRVSDTDYDDEGRVSKVSRPEGWVSYGYDEVTGRPDRLETSLSQTKYEYDLLGRLASVEEWKRNGQAFPAPVVTAYGYTKDGQIESVAYRYGSTHYRVNKGVRFHF